MKNHPFISVFIFLFLLACEQKKSPQTTEQTVETVSEKEVRIVSLKGTFSELLASFNLADQVIGTDVTSTYPENIAKLPKLGHTRNLSVEGILALNPTLILADPTELKSSTIEQLNSTGIKLLLISQEYSIDGSKKLIQALGDSLKVEKELVTPLIENIDKDLTEIKTLKTAPKILFIYARGAGTLMVAGENTQMQTVIELAGGQNAIKGFSDFKPLTPEALVTANPDAILMFNSGKESLDGDQGVLEIPGMKETRAGKEKNIITIDGLLLSGFGPRIGKVTVQLNQEFAKLTNE